MRGGDCQQARQGPVLTGALINRQVGSLTGEAGGGSQIIRLEKAIKRNPAELGESKVRHVKETTFAGANGALHLAQDMPAEFWNQLEG